MFTVPVPMVIKTVVAMSTPEEGVVHLHWKAAVSVSTMTVIWCRTRHTSDYMYMYVCEV